jgi:hypothetical protein
MLAVEGHVTFLQPSSQDGGCWGRRVCRARSASQLRAGALDTVSWGDVIFMRTQLIFGERAAQILLFAVMRRSRIYQLSPFICHLSTNAMVANLAAIHLAKHIQDRPITLRTRNEKGLVTHLFLR